MIISDIYTISEDEILGSSEQWHDYNVPYVHVFVVFINLWKISRFTDDHRNVI